MDEFMPDLDVDVPDEIVDAREVDDILELLGKHIRKVSSETIREILEETCYEIAILKSVDKDLPESFADYS